MIGIYKITNQNNGKVYIGQSKNLSHRKATHIYDLKHNMGHNKEMQKDFNDNPDAFKFEVLCKCSENDLDMLEKTYIKLYNSNNLE